MRPVWGEPSPATAILTLAEIKVAVDAFDRGDTNVFDTLDAIIVAVAAHQATATSDPRRDAA
jgi:hypothetical protein